MIEKVLIYVFSAVAEVLTAKIFFRWLGENKLKYISNIVISLFFIILQSFNSLFLNESNLMMFITMSILFFISLTYKINWVMRFIGSIILCIIMALTEMIVVVLTTLGGKISVPTIQENAYFFAICTILAKFITYIIVNLISHKKHYISSGFSVKFIIAIFILPIASIIVIVLLYHCCYVIESQIYQTLTLFSSILLFASNILEFFIINKQSDYISTKEQLNFAQQNIQNQMEHYSELYKYQEEIRYFKHDMKNFFISLKAALSDNDFNTVMDNIDKKLDLLNENQKTAINTQNPILDSIISVKRTYADEYNIKFDLSIKTSSPIIINELEFGVLIGNALDNAIEAVRDLPIEHRIVYIQIITIGETLSINIRNPIDRLVDTSASSKLDKKNHGYGLKSMRSIVQRYNGNLDILCEDNIFSLNILMSNIHK